MNQLSMHFDQPVKGGIMVHKRGRERSKVDNYVVELRFPCLDRYEMLCAIKFLTIN